MTFPTANSTIIRNEDGEPMGFETNSYDEPEYNPDDYLYEDEEPDVWGDPDACEAEGHHGKSLNKTNEGTWECAACGWELPAASWGDYLPENAR